jgi:RNA polymerase-binding transcription factor DksA/very-short-patch-repair endonuclease
MTAPSLLLDEVVAVLRGADVPLRARDIVTRLDPGADPTELKREVNRLLYGPLRSFVAQDGDSRWRLVRDPTLAAPREVRTRAVANTTGVPEREVPVAPDVAATIQRSLEAWKKDLIDFGRKNKLLYFNSSRRTKLKLTKPTLESLYEGLVLRDKTYTFSTPIRGDLDLIELQDDVETPDVGERRGDIEVDYELSSAKDVVSLQRKLFRLRTDARSTLNEQGINTLHVGLGVLRWQESDASAEWIDSPIVLIPSSLDREKNGPYKLSGFEGDVVVNPTLAHRLRHDFDLELPPLDPFDGFGEEADPVGYLAAISRAVRDRGWSVSQDLWLTHFSFEKLVMFEDLGQPATVEAIANHPVLSALTGTDEVEEPAISFQDASGAYELPEAYPVVDADSSQLEVLVRARVGTSMVVQGPPGTGKSQTIVNLIAQAIRDGRSVLFVSEKRAALEVVYRRLREAGLSDLCLELHSHKANKREVVRDLFLALEASRETTNAANDALFQERLALRRRLDAYVTAVHERRGGGQHTAYEMHGELAQLSDVPATTADLPVTPYLDLTREKEASMTRALNELVFPGVWGAEAQHPWRGCQVEGPAFAAREEILPQAGRLVAALDEAIDAKASTERLLGISLGAGSIERLPEVASILQGLVELPTSTRSSWLTEPRERFSADLRLATEASGKTQNVARAAERLEANGARQLVEDPQLVQELLPRYQGSHKKRFGRMSGAYRRDKRRLRAAVTSKPGFEESCSILEQARISIAAQSWLRDNGPALHVVMGAAWPEDPAAAEGIVQDLRSVDLLRALLPDEGLPMVAAERLTEDFPGAKGQSWMLRSTIQTATDQAATSADALARWHPMGLDGVRLEDKELEDLRIRATLWREHGDLLDQWSAYTRALQGCDREGLTPFIEAARRIDLPAEQLSPALRRLIATRWVTEAYRSDSALGAFDAKSHAAAIEAFCRLDKALLEEARQAVRYGASQRQRDVRVAARFATPGMGRAPEEVRAARDEYKKIKREFEKTRRHIPLRRLLPDLPNILPVVKPCLLMSPLSVASYLPRDRFRFDLVIFDEASQVLPADAVGAILRATQVIVFGDSKQLPPTDFFRKRLDDGEDEDYDLEESYVDSSAFASILEACSTALPEAWLRWHYRSRDERLIAFSNRTFYSERPLITFPNPDSEADYTGVHFEYVANGLYDRGGSRTNIEEARHVADKVIEHLDRHGWDRSLGVITLGIAQRDIIELELRRRLSERPELGPYVAEEGNEPFFIKNLETVQGDERDDIILSLGFGPSEPGGLPALSFGPVAAKGGERRLNVAVTRAKYSMTLVTSMRPEHLDRASLLSNEGPKVLGSYMRYAARGGRFDDEAEADPNRQPESPFEEAVVNALRQREYLVDPQVGVSHFRIDIGVRHPDIPSRYLLGIECDGATYHRAASARDRDRLRQEVLEEQGWRIYRIWSTDWIQHPGRALEVLVDEIERLRALDEPSVPRRTGPEPPATPPASVVVLDQPEPSERAIVDLPAPFLEEQRQSLLFELSRLERQVASMGAAQADVKGQPDRGFSGGLVERALKQRLEQVRSALDAIAEGTYGRCKRCGRAIELERLEAVPSTPFCRECSQSADG